MVYVPTEFPIQYAASALYFIFLPVSCIFSDTRQTEDEETDTYIYLVYPHVYLINEPPLIWKFTAKGFSWFS